MNVSAKLNRLLKNLLIYSLVFSVLAVLLFFQQRGYVASSNADESRLIDEDDWYQVRNENAGKLASNAPKCLVIYGEADPSSTSLKDNVAYTLTTLGVNVSELAAIVYEEPDTDELDGEPGNTVVRSAAEKNPLQIDCSKYDDIVICFSSLSSTGIDIDALAAWCQNGGHLMLAGGLDESVDFAGWGDLLGISLEKRISSVPADSLRFHTELLAGVNGREFSDDVISCNILNCTLNNDCVLHLSTGDETGAPILWEHPFGKGMVIVCNGDIMEAKCDRGIVAASYCRFYPVYAYPVINACVYCIDDLPSPIPAGYDDNITSQYGYTVSDFYANVWMPAMQSLYEKYGIKFSTFTIQTYEDNVEGPFNNTDYQKYAVYYASLILNMGGEIGIHGYNHQPLVMEGYQLDEENAGYKPWTSLSSMIEATRNTIAYTESLADDVFVQAYVAPSNVISNEALHEMLNQLDAIRVYAGVYIGTPDQFIQEYEVLENGTVFCPRLTADMQMEDSEWWTQINELNFHYIESNFIHPDDILDEERSDGGDFNQMVSGYTEMIEWNQSMGLNSTTISDCGAAVQRYGNLSYRQELSGNELTLQIDGLIDTAYFMVRTNGKRIVSATGADVRSLNDGTYILTVTSDTVTARLVDRS